MPRQTLDSYDDGEEEEEYVPDEDEEWVPDDDDEDDTMPCPHCGEAIYDGAEQCPECGKYISEEDAPRRSWPAWVVLGFIAAFAVTLMWVFS